MPSPIVLHGAFSTSGTAATHALSMKASWLNNIDACCVVRIVDSFHETCFAAMLGLSPVLEQNKEGWKLLIMSLVFLGLLHKGSARIVVDTSSSLIQLQAPLGSARYKGGIDKLQF